MIKRRGCLFIRSDERLKWLQMARIEYKTGRTKAGRWVELTPLPLPDDAAGDGGDDGDGVFGTPLDSQNTVTA